MRDGPGHRHREGVLEELEVRIELLGRVGGEPPARLARGEAEHGGGEDPLELDGVVIADARVVQRGVDRVAGPPGPRRGRRPLQQEREDLRVAQRGGPGPAGERGEAVRPGLGRVGQRHLPEDPLDDAVEEVGLVGDVAVQRHGRDPEAVGHRLHRHRGQALLVGQLQAGRQHRAAVDLGGPSHAGQYRPAVGDRRGGAQSPAGAGARTGAGAGGAARPAVADLLHRGHRVAQLADPVRLVLGHQADAPGQRLAPAAGHAGVDQRVEHAAVAHAQPGHHRHAGRGEEGLGPPALRPPRHGAPEGRLGLLRDAHAGRPGLLAEPTDPGLLGHPACRPHRLPRAARGAARVPTTWISSPSISMVGLPSNHESGTRPANQAPINRSCSGPDGGGLAERRLPRGRPFSCRSFHRSYYEITSLLATSTKDLGWEFLCIFHTFISYT